MTYASFYFEARKLFRTGQRMGQQNIEADAGLADELDKAGLVNKSHAHSDFGFAAKLTKNGSSFPAFVGQNICRAGVMKKTIAC